jgi:hypothetical protein
MTSLYGIGELPIVREHEILYGLVDGVYVNDLYHGDSCCDLDFHLSSLIREFAETKQWGLRPGDRLQAGLHC